MPKKTATNPLDLGAAIERQEKEAYDKGYSAGYKAGRASTQKPYPKPNDAVLKTFSTRVANALSFEWDGERGRYGKKRRLFAGKEINTVADVAGLDATELARVRNFGHTSMQEVVRVLARYGLELKNLKDVAPMLK